MAEVTFILPMLNERAFIGRALESIFEQSVPRGLYEVVLIDCGSTDGSLEIAANYDVRVEQRIGESISALRNWGAKRADGKYLVFMDSDCAIDKNWLETGLEYFEDESVGIVGQFGDADPDASNWFQRAIAFRDNQIQSVEERSWLPTRGIIVRRDLFDNVGGFNELLETAEDVDLCYRIHRTHRILRVKRMRTWHLGEDSNPATHFRKEIWRGRFGLRRALSEGVDRDELPSLLLPWYYIVVEVGLLVSLSRMLFQGGSALVLVFLGLLLVPPLAFSFYRCVRGRSFRYLLPLAFALLVYMSSRSIALIYELAQMARQKIADSK